MCDAAELERVAAFAMDQVCRTGDLRVADAFVAKYGSDALVSRFGGRAVNMARSATLAGRIQAAEWLLRTFGQTFTWDADSDLLTCACERGDLAAVRWLATVFGVSPLASALISGNSRLIEWTVYVYRHKDGELEFTRAYCARCSPGAVALRLLHGVGDFTGLRSLRRARQACAPLKREASVRELVAHLSETINALMRDAATARRAQKSSRKRESHQTAGISVGAATSDTTGVPARTAAYSATTAS